MNECKVDGCTALVKYKGLCGKHYKRQWRYGDPTKTLLKMERTQCKAPGCDRLDESQGYCHMHYIRLTRHGRLHTVKAPDGSGTLTNLGYRLVTVNGRRELEHRVVAERALGKPLPPGAVVHHVNGNTLNNHPSNLVLCPNQSYHMLLEQRTRQLFPNGINTGAPNE